MNCIKFKFKNNLSEVTQSDILNTLRDTDGCIEVDYVSHDDRDDAVSLLGYLIHDGTFPDSYWCALMKTSLFFEFVEVDTRKD